MQVQIYWICSLGCLTYVILIIYAYMNMYTRNYSTGMYAHVGIIYPLDGYENYSMAILFFKKPNYVHFSPN